MLGQGREKAKISFEPSSWGLTKLRCYSRDHEEAAGSESYSGRGSIHRNGHEDGDSLYEEKPDDRPENDVDGDDDDTSAGSDEEESVVVKIDPKEQEEFDRELKAHKQESLESRKLEVRSKSTLNMSMPMSVLEGPKDPRAAETESGQKIAAEESGNAGAGSKAKVSVRVLVKKGHKRQTKQMRSPETAHLFRAQSSKRRLCLSRSKILRRRF